MTKTDLQLLSPLTIAEQSRLNEFAEKMFAQGYHECNDHVFVGLAVARGNEVTTEERNHLRLKWYEMLEEATEPEKKDEAEASDAGHGGDHDERGAGGDDAGRERERVGGSEGGQGDGAVDPGPASEG